LRIEISEDLALPERISSSARDTSGIARPRWLRLLARDTGALTGGLVVSGVIVLALVGPALTGYDAAQVDPMNRLLPPSSRHWIGTDTFGRDVLTRMLYGARVSLLVGLATMLLTTMLGAFLGLVAGYIHAADGPIMRVMDGFMAFPSLLLAIAIMAALGARTENVIAALSVVYLPRVARLVRGQVLVIRELMYVEAARAMGAHALRIIFRHILPNSTSPLIVQGSFTFALAVIAEASLSFLGAGVPPEVPAWGNMLQDGVRVMAVAPWLSVMPGLAIAVTVLGLNLLGDGLRDCLDPRMHEG
jgi:peptide/nickel transport system permease protein